jgi:3-dehydroquinate synthase
MHVFRVELAEKSYPIYIDSGLLGQANLVARHLRGEQIMIVSDPQISSLYLEKLKVMIPDAIDVDVVLVEPGEEHKDFNSLNLIIDALISKQHRRNTTLIALGGGMVGDLTGFAASCYQRGVHLIQIPTTLLAQVDASVGGKTAINHPKAKNMIGSFYQPECVIIDTDTLASLDDRQFRSGIAEIIKAALIRDPDFFAWLEENMTELLVRKPSALTHAIRQACAIKTDIISHDPFDEHDRALLNFGHTFGHAIEQNSGYGEVLHGEAVAMGIIMATQLSQRRNWLSEETVARVSNLIAAAGLPTTLPSHLDLDQFCQTMLLDKKTTTKGPRFVLLKDIGSAVLAQDVEPELVNDVAQEAVG